MSLVYEALQKAEREKERKTGAAAAEPRLTQSPAVNVAVQVATTPVHSGGAPIVADVATKTLVGLIAAIALLVLMAMAWWIRDAIKRDAGHAKLPEPVPAATPAAVQTEPRAPETVVPALPPPGSTENDPRFKLTGIMKMGNNYGAVINGHVVYEGNYVDGAIVKKVERDRVTLQFNGREIVVRLF
jgi:hypothetical protein